MITKDLGMVTAYAYAVSKGYTGTEEEFAELMASYASVAQEAVDAALAAAQSAQNAQDAKTAAEGARDTAQNTVSGAIAGIQAEGQTQIGAVQSEGTTQVGNVNSAGQTQVGNVNAAGTTQVGNVNTAGSTQMDAVQAKGTEVLNSIPSDYTELSDNVSGLKSALIASELLTDESVSFATNNDYAVSSDTGELVSIAGMRYTIIDLTDSAYQSLSFKTSTFGSNYGYGFVLSDNSWSGVHTTSTGNVTVNVPQGAKTFKLCWNPSSVSTQEITAIAIYKVQDGVNLVKTDVVDILETAEIFDDGDVDFTTKNDYVISSTTGELISIAGMRYTIIDLSKRKYTKLTFNVSAFGGNYGYGFSLSDGTWTGTHTTANETVNADVPNNAVEFRLCWNPSNVGTQSIQGMSYAQVQTDINALDAKVSNMMERFEIEQNIDVSDATTGYGISSETGDVAELAPGAYIVIDLTEKDYKSLTFKVTAFGGNYGYGFVLSDNTWKGVHTLANTTVTESVPEGAKTFKLCWNFNNLPIASQTVTADCYTNAEEIIGMINNDVSGQNVYPLAIDPTINIASEAPVVVPAYNVETDIYAKYDALMANFPDWITKVNTSDADSEIGVTKPAYLSGLNIYMYKFSAKRTNLAENQKRLTVMITTGTHPMEAMGIFNVFYFFKWINENWRTNDTALQLRTMVDFYVIPCVCPLGYNNILRTNRPVADGGVNINRNFPTKNWTQSGAGTADYSGASAGSEYETKIIMHYANAIKPHIYFDAHTGSMPNGRYGCIELNGASKNYVVDFAYAYAMGLIKDWICNNTDFPQYIDENPLFNVNVSNVYTGASFRWFEENITDYAFLTEESIDNYWKNGVLTTSNPETGTARIFNENFKAVYGAIVWAVYCACKIYQSD